MLPIFPKARSAMRNAFNNEVFRAMWDVSPILKEIRVRPQTEGNEASYEQDNGKIVDLDYKLQSVKRHWQFEDAQGLAPEDFHQIAADLGEEMGNRMLAGIFETIERVTQEVGNVVNFEGKGMTFEKFLEMLANVYTEFDDSGRPQVKTFVGSPEACRQYEESVKEWTSDPAKRAEIERIMEHHRKVFDEREACRRMVD